MDTVIEFFGYVFLGCGLGLVLLLAYGVYRYFLGDEGERRTDKPSPTGEGSATTNRREVQELNPALIHAALMELEACFELAGQLYVPALIRSGRLGAREPALRVLAHVCGLIGVGIQKREVEIGSVPSADRPFCLPARDGYVYAYLRQRVPASAASAPAACEVGS